MTNLGSNIPRTRRDDPTLGKTVSSLTSEEYSVKAEAFVPSDVRIMCGCSENYGHVRDLPSSKDFDPAMFATEPGRSTGAACTNALLKVLYDETHDTFVDPVALFDNDKDNDDCDDDVDSDVNPQSQSGMSLSEKKLAAASLSSGMDQITTITWADLLCKMKAEVELLGHSQIPMITSSRKFDLNKPFFLVPNGFNPTKNEKRSLLIGCNYSDNAVLKASHDDILCMKDYIVNVCGFPETPSLMNVLMDDGEHQAPTKKNITQAFKALSEQARPGDAVFVHFAGHGGRVLDDESTSTCVGSGDNPFDEFIVPSDYKESGFIKDTLIFEALLAPMQKDVLVTIILDACDCGIVMNMPYAWSSRLGLDRPGSAEMTFDDDFSFFRFLKVVKSLGAAVELSDNGETFNDAVSKENDEEDDESLVVGGSLQSAGENEQKRNVAVNAALSRAFGSCTGTGTDW